MAQQSTVCETLLLLEDVKDFQEQLPRLVDSCSLSVDNLCESLDALLFSQTPIRDAVSRFARNHRNALVRIMIKDPSPLIGENHQLLLLQQRLTDKIKIKQLMIEPTNKLRSYIIGDNCHVLLQHQEHNYSGFYNSNAKPEAKELGHEFNELWQRHTINIIELQRLGI